MRYHKKPVVIDAFRLGYEPVPDWANRDELVVSELGGASVETLEGTMLGNHGDWIIKGVKGELYPCRADIFEATYEAVP